MDSHLPLIRWVNHASFILEHNGVALITDPWLFGRAFNDGWTLLSPTPVVDFERITHIWFSHEHPDHFCPPVLQSIPLATRARITVLFQQTLDRKVAKFCEKLGFVVNELPSHAWVTLATGVRVMCGKVPYFDSWLLMEAGGKRILDANDCVVDGEGIAHEIARHTGPVDVLLTQFSYANWIGNPEDREERRASAREKLARVKIQADAFEAQYVVPFASMVCFCHEENAYLNDAMNTVRDAHDYIAREVKRTPVVLYPGDVWVAGTPHDNADALARYDYDYAAAAAPSVKARSVPIEQIVPLARAYIDRVKQRNSRLMMRGMAAPPLRYFAPVTIELTDLARVVTFDFRDGLRPSPNGTGHADISMGSQSLEYIFAHDWGYETLEVNGRFRASPSGHRRAVKMFFLGPLNNTGRYLRFRTFVDVRFLKRAVSKLRQLAKG